MMKVFVASLSQEILKTRLDIFYKRSALAQSQILDLNLQLI